MAKKVTISIPDMLHEKLEQWRESFNLSKMFQEAVTEAIQRKEEFQKRIREDIDLGQIIDRLRQEKLESEGNYFDSGRNDGIRWAKTAHYDDIQYALNWANFTDAAKDPVFGDYFVSIQSSHRLFKKSTYHNPEYFLNFVKGWKAGIEQFWEEVQDKI